MLEASTQSPGVHIDLRHVSRLLQKMNEGGFVETFLVTKGKDDNEVVTMKRLMFEIQEAIKDKGGRASSHQLEAIVRVDTPAIDEALKRLCAEDPERLCIESQESIEILTPQYIDSLAKIIHETATQKGRVTIDELSATFKLPTNVMKDVISSRVSDSSALLSTTSRMWNQVLVTEAYEREKKSALCALCNAATQPISVEELMRLCQLQDDEKKMAIWLMEDLTKGSLTTAREREFLPDSFVAAQHAAAYTFFSDNGYLDIATATTMGVRRLHAFVKEKYPDAECLETVAVSRGVVEQLNAVADEAVARDSWFEETATAEIAWPCLLWSWLETLTLITQRFVRNSEVGKAWAVVPTSLSEVDAARLVAECSACKRGEDEPLRLLQLGEVYGVSIAFMEDIVNRFRREILSSATCPDSGSGGGSREEHLAHGGGVSRKGKDRRRGGRKAVDAAVDLPQHEVEGCISSCKPELADHPRLVSALSSHLAQRFVDAKAEAARLAKGVSAGKAYRQADAFDATFESKYLAFQLFCRGVQALRNALRRRKAADDVPGQVSSMMEASAVLSQEEGQVGKLDGTDSCGCYAEAYLVKTRGASLAALITSRECEKLGITFASQVRSHARQGTECMPSVTQEARSALVEVLPQDVGRALANLWQAVMDVDSLGRFSEILQKQVFPACNLVGRRLDKRKERQLMAEEERAMKAHLFRSESESEVLHYATLLVFQNVTGAVLLLPPWMSRPHADVDGREPRMAELWSSVLLDVLRGHISSETELVLSDLQQGITGQVSGASSSVPPSELDTCGGEGNSTKGFKSEEQRKSDGVESATVRLMRATEAVRALGLACGE